MNTLPSNFFANKAILFYNSKPFMFTFKNSTLSVLLLLWAITALAQKKNILIYTHNGKGYVHENIATSVKALEEICQKQGWKTSHSDAPQTFDDDLSKYHCIIFSNTNNEAFDTESQRDNFKKYINQGGAFVGIHSASGSERQWPWFWSMLGGKFVRHPVLQPFTIKVVQKNHPATASLPAIWAWEDEFYYLNQLNPDIQILLAGNIAELKDDKKAEYPGATFGDYFPLSWCHTFDGGRQFYTALGHKASYYADPLFRAHLLGGIKWVMKVK